MGVAISVMAAQIRATAASRLAGKVGSLAAMWMRWEVSVGGIGDPGGERGNGEADGCKPAASRYGDSLEKVAHFNRIGNCRGKLRSSEFETSCLDRQIRTKKVHHAASL